MSESGIEIVKVLHKGVQEVISNGYSLSSWQQPWKDRESGKNNRKGEIEKFIAKQQVKVVPVRAPNVAPNFTYNWITKDCWIETFDINKFKTSDGYYTSMFHELGHMAGYFIKGDIKSKKWGDKTYAIEEATAEGVAVLLGERYNTMDLINSIRYIGNWLSSTGVKEWDISPAIKRVEFLEKRAEKELTIVEKISSFADRILN
jgi:hypothetical protein